MKRRSFPFTKIAAFVSMVSILLYAMAVIFGSEVFFFPTIVFFAVSFGITSVSFVTIGAISLFAEGASTIARKQFIGMLFLFGALGAVLFAQLFIDSSNKLDPWSYYVAGFLFLLVLIFCYFGILYVFKPPVNYRVKGAKLQAY